MAISCLYESHGVKLAVRSQQRFIVPKARVPIGKDWIVQCNGK